MKLTAFRAILVLGLLALAVGQKSKGSSRKSSRKSTTTTEAPQIKTTVAPPASRGPAQPWSNRRGDTGSSSSWPGTFPGPGASGGSGPHRNNGRYNGPSGISNPGAPSGRSRNQGRNNYQGPGIAPGAGNSQGASGIQGSGSSQGPNNAQGAGNSQGPNSAQSAGNTQGPNTAHGMMMRHPGRGRPGPPQYYLSWRHAPRRRPLYTWQEADDLCRQAGRKLISINTMEKQSYLAWVLDEDEIHSVWTSGKFREGSFKWADNTEVNSGFTDWSMAGRYQPQPDNREGFEDCVSLYSEGAGGWHDEQCQYRKHFVCEF